MPQAVAQLPWGRSRTLLDKTETGPERDWYAAAAGEHGWSRKMLMNMIMSQTRERIGSAPSHFADLLPAPGSELAQQAAKDPYNFEFLGLSGEGAERDLEQRLTDRIVETLRDLGPGDKAWTPWSLVEGEAGNSPAVGGMAGLFLSLGPFGAAPAVGERRGAAWSGYRNQFARGRSDKRLMTWPGTQSFPGFRQGSFCRQAALAAGSSPHPG